MRVMTAMDLRRRLGEALDRAAAGERIVVERDRRPVAVIVSVEDAQRLDHDAADRSARVRSALDRLQAFAARMATDHPETHGGPDAAATIRLERDHGHRA